MTFRQRILDRERGVRYRQRHPERVKRNKRIRQRIYSLKHKFNMTEEQYVKLLRKQKNGCAICFHKPYGKDRYRKGRSLAVDHNHKTKKNRGLLCDLCNRALGQFQDNIKILRKAVRYLEKFDKQ